jgi:hypothetical protein
VSFSADQFRALLDNLLPQDAFRTGSTGSGNAVWMRSGNLWTLNYVTEVSAISCVNVKDGRRLVDVTLFRDGVLNIAAALKAVGALSD